MPNGFFMARAQPMDYRALLQTQPLGGLMGGIQQGLAMRQQMQEMRLREEQQQALEQKATLEEQRQALAMQAATGDPEAMQALTAMDPQAALQMQQIAGLRAEREREEEDRQREEGGRLGSLLKSANKRNVREIYERAVMRIRKEDDDETVMDLPSRQQAQDMSNDELLSVMQDVGTSLEAFALGPEKAAELRMERAELEEKRITRLAKAAKEGKVEKMPAIKDPPSGRNEFSKLSKEFREQVTAYNRVEASIKDPSPAGDIALIFNYMKVLDPGSTVRETEAATLENAAGVPEVIRAKWNRTLKGERLTEKTRKDFVNQSRNLIEPAIQEQIKREETFSRLAKKSNIDPEDVVIDFIGDLRPKTKDEAPGLKPEDTEPGEIEPIEEDAVIPSVTGAPGAPAAAAGPAKIVTEQRQTPDGRTIVRYSDGTMAVF